MSLCQLKGCDLDGSSRIPDGLLSARLLPGRSTIISSTTGLYQHEAFSAHVAVLLCRSFVLKSYTLKDVSGFWLRWNRGLYTLAQEGVNIIPLSSQPHCHAGEPP